MSDYVWVSDARNDPELMKKASNDLTESDLERAKTSLKAIKAGHPVDPEHLPNQLYLDRGKGQRLPPLFDAGGFYLVNGNVADILSQHDLGEGILHPVELLLRDRKTPAKGDWYCWVFGNRKSAFTNAGSRNLRPFGASETWAKLAYEPADFDVAVTGEALEGPDVWIDPPLFKTFFLSQALGDQLDAAGLAQGLRFSRARVVGTEAKARAEVPRNV